MRGLISIVSALHKFVTFLNAEERRGRRKGTQSLAKFNPLRINEMLYLVEDCTRRKVCLTEAIAPRDRPLHLLLKTVTDYALQMNLVFLSFELWQLYDVPPCQFPQQY